ncbi:hypothetical protein C8Q77DRAFT_1143590 [Trametes polyzona]|nr:hypothetical protein C8Q77DRAFT_1143590 [Trametes polyzona]
MHQALRTNDIIQYIFDYCAPPQGPPARLTLYHLACCCKAWQGPALDRLWARLEDQKPLMNLLSHYQTDDGEKDIRLELPERFYRYASRVKAISYNTRLDFCVAGPDAGPVLPRLETITVRGDGYLVPTPWMLSPRLKDISVFLSSGEETQAPAERMAEYLTQAHQIAPDWHTLSISVAMSRRLNTAVSTLTQLQHLSLDAKYSLRCETLVAVATFPNLRSLDVDISAIPHVELTAALSNVAAPRFPRLENLVISAETRTIDMVLRHLVRGVLKRFRMKIGDPLPGDAEHLQPVLYTLAQKTSSTLVELSIEDRAHYAQTLAYLRDDYDDDRGWYSLSILAPLAALRQLRSFILRSNLPSTLTDADLEEMGRWWPQLEVLDLNVLNYVYPFDASSVQITPAALPIVARSMPHLVELTLPVPASQLADPEPVDASGSDALTPRPQQRTLRMLAIGIVGRGKDYPQRVVETVLRTFPCLRFLECPTPEVSQHFLATRCARPLEDDDS